jgi:hypothetical protein
MSPASLFQARKDYNRLVENRNKPENNNMAIEKRMSLAGRPSVIRSGRLTKINLNGRGWAIEIDEAVYDLSFSEQAEISRMIQSYLDERETDDGR